MKKLQSEKTKIQQKLSLITYLISKIKSIKNIISDLLIKDEYQVTKESKMFIVANICPAHKMNYPE